MLTHLCICPSQMERTLAKYTAQQANALAAAAHCGDAAAVRQLLADGSHADEAGYDGRTALQVRLALPTCCLRPQCKVRHTASRALLAEQRLSAQQ
jgi:hypothetical protein